MPKKISYYTKGFNVRVSEFDYKYWKNIHKEKGFASVAHMIRFCVNDFLEEDKSKFKDNSKQVEFKNKMKSLENNNKTILKQQNDILKLVADRLANNSHKQKDPKLKEYQKTIVLNLLEEKPRDEIELTKITSIDEYEILEVLNNLLESSLIKRAEDKNKFEVVI